MSNHNSFPKTLQQAMQYFSDENTCVEFVASIRWSFGIECPYCKGKELSKITTRRKWQCKNKECKKQFSVKVGTIFEDSALSLTKWLPAMWLISNAKNGISSYELHRAIGVTQKTAWFMNHRIRTAMKTGTFEKLTGDVECDETFIGGQAKNMHAEKRRERVKGRGAVGKEIVMGLLERGGEVKTKHINNTKRSTLHKHIAENVEHGSTVHTDAFPAYKGLDERYVHEVIDHAVAYVHGNVSTNGLENYWSLLKRTIKGTYVSVDAYHLMRYLDEQSFRYNARQSDDANRFLEVLESVAGRRLTYEQLTGGLS